ncbi:DUF2218 domain-containing protein [Azospirillum thermophilum]|uniref:DUF2218 domain-containing protein n=1 Tax=Azospirillum thermophilum TaxID=2202148 RepID=A0A2S2CZ30_9PROT|nr:DUF2218 domain-containing protein [Azospirillum thermophilum]AWK89746.1 DUF2218 domain-containing protein [Azospirillum thermophilum]
MPVQQARVGTALASRYLVQLCKHFAHKIPVEYDGRRGRADFPWGVCHMTAGDDTLDLRCEAPDAQGLDRVKAVVDDHLRRFAWRETPVLSWEEPAG